MPTTETHPPLLEVRDLRTSFVTTAGVVPAVDGVSITIPRGKTVALVGESGCGKSVTALSILRLIPQPPGRIDSGSVRLHEDGEAPVDVLALPEKRLRGIRGGRIAMIFQDPLVAMNPVFTIGEQIVEAIELHQPVRGKDAEAAAVDALRRVGIAAPEQRLRDYPHQLSGGMLQRAMIAMALSCNPSLLIADEPTTALDVTIQAQILDLLDTLQTQTGMSMLMITHDLGVVARIADYVYVMYAGRIVEHAPVKELFAEPLHPYTQGLMRCTPQLSMERGRLESIPGTVPAPTHLPSGCRFHPRCGLSARLAADTDADSLSAPSFVGDKVLARCAGSPDATSKADPALQERRADHYVACPEAAV